MPVWKEDRTHFYLCDVCKHRTTIEIPRNFSWDEARLTTARLKERGWRLTKVQGQWEALCPECAQYSGYKMGPDGLD